MSQPHLIFIPAMSYNKNIKYFLKELDEMNDVKDILKYMGYIIIIPSYIIFFILFFAYLSFFCSQILTGKNINEYFYDIFKNLGCIIPNNMSINIYSSFIILSTLLSFICTITYMIKTLKINNKYIINDKIKFNISFLIFILLNFISIVFINNYKHVPSAIHNSTIIPVGIGVWILVLLITYSPKK